jgi:hypothetical protein
MNVRLEQDRSIRRDRARPMPPSHESRSRRPPATLAGKRAGEGIVFDGRAAMYHHCLIAGALAGAFVLTATSRAQAQVTLPPPPGQSSIDLNKQHDLSDVHSVLQKTGLATLAVTGVLGASLAVNTPTLFGEGRCATGSPWFGQFGCTGLKYAHFGFAATTLGLFVATEIVAEQMPVSPYDMGSTSKQSAMKTLRVVNIALFSVQPVLGFLAANHSLFGMSGGAAKVLRTVHLAVGGTVAGTYTANAAMQW